MKCFRRGLRRGWAWRTNLADLNSFAVRLSTGAPLRRPAGRARGTHRACPAPTKIETPAAPRTILSRSSHGTSVALPRRTMSNNASSEAAQRAGHQAYALRTGCTCPPSEVPSGCSDRSGRGEASAIAESSLAFIMITQRVRRHLSGLRLVVRGCDSRRLGSVGPGNWYRSSCNAGSQRGFNPRAKSSAIRQSGARMSPPSSARRHQAALYDARLTTYALI